MLVRTYRRGVGGRGGIYHVCSLSWILNENVQRKQRQGREKGSERD